MLSMLIDSGNKASQHHFQPPAIVLVERKGDDDHATRCEGDREYAEVFGATDQERDNLPCDPLTFMTIYVSSPRQRASILTEALLGAD